MWSEPMGKFDMITKTSRTHGGKWNDNFVDVASDVSLSAEFSLHFSTESEVDWLLKILLLPIFKLFLVTLHVQLHATMS